MGARDKSKPTTLCAAAQQRLEADADLAALDPRCLSLVRWTGDMWAFWIIVSLWNACALALGVIGLYKPASRDRLAGAANRQVTAAAGVSLVCFALGILGSALGPVGGAILVAAWASWALGGLFPFTIVIFLRARKRGEVATISASEPTAR